MTELSDFKTAYDLSIESLKRRVAMLELANKDKSEVIIRLTQRIKDLEDFNVMVRKADEKILSEDW